MKLEKPYSTRDLVTIDDVADGSKRCRICKEVKNLTEFRVLSNKGKSWLYYACNPCSRELQRQYYQRRRKKLPVAEECGKLEPEDTMETPGTLDPIREFTAASL